MPRSPRTWIDGPTCLLLSAHFLKPAPFLDLSYLSFLIFTKRRSLSSSLEVLPCFHTVARLYPFPNPGQPDAIGASSLRDPVPYLFGWSPLPDTSFHPSLGPKVSGHQLDRFHLLPIQIKIPWSSLAVGLLRER